MKKIFFFICFITLFGCTGYEPLFSTKNISFYIKDVENINGDTITKQVIRNLSAYREEVANKKNYVLKISSNSNNNITSKDTKGDALTYQLFINVDVEVFDNESKFPLNTFNFSKNFTYKNQVNKFDLGNYKENIKGNLVGKISEDIIIKLQSL